MEVPPSHAHRRTYCSYDCKHVDPVYRKKIGPIGDKNGHWKGGVVPHPDGYVYQRAYGHPFSSNGYVLQHRLIVEKWLVATEPGSPFLVEVGGRLVLSPDIEVHHKDEVRDHNAIENLECLTRAEHHRLHTERRRAAKKQPS